MSSSHPTAARPRVLTDVLPGDRVRDVVVVLGFAIAIAVSAQLRIPLPGTTVPLTGQTFVVLAGAIALGAPRATAGSLLYLAVGVAGVPWFAVSSGASIGYIVGFVLASIVLGAIAQRGGARRPTHVAAAMLLGNVLIYALGATGMAVVLGLDLPAALAAGVAPYLIGDAIKLAAAVAVVPALWKLVGSQDREA